VVCTNTIPGGERLAPIKDRYVELCVANMLGEAIHRIHHNMSVSALFRKTAGAKR
jgi:phosphoribosylpyrophosphate synthetase